MGLSHLQTPLCMPKAVPFISFSKDCVTPRGWVLLLCGRAPGVSTAPTPTAMPPGCLLLTTWEVELSLTPPGVGSLGKPRFPHL